MSPRTGRPKKDNAKKGVIIIRLEETEKNAFEQFCKSKEISMSDYLRKMIRDTLSEQK